jgi:hypothetical protein
MFKRRVNLRRASSASRDLQTSTTPSEDRIVYRPRMLLRNHILRHLQDYRWGEVAPVQDYRATRDNPGQREGQRRLRYMDTGAYPIRIDRTKQSYLEMGLMVG